MSVGVSAGTVGVSDAVQVGVSEGVLLEVSDGVYVSVRVSTGVFVSIAGVVGVLFFAHPTDSIIKIAIKIKSFFITFPLSNTNKLYSIFEPISMKTF